MIGNLTLQSLTPTEFALLRHLLAELPAHSRPGRLARYLHCPTDAIKVHVFHLRQKDIPIDCDRRWGYRLVVDELNTVAVWREAVRREVARRQRPAYPAEDEGVRPLKQ